jgi:hypothetical protein
LAAALTSLSVVENRVNGFIEVTLNATGHTFQPPFTLMPSTRFLLGCRERRLVKVNNVSYPAQGADNRIGGEAENGRQI